MFFSPANMVFSCTTGMVGVLFSSRQLIFKWINVCGMIRHLCNVLFSVPGYFLCYQIILGMTLSKRGWLAMRDRCCVCSKMKKMRLVQKTISEILKRKVWKTVLAQLFGKSNQQHRVSRVTLCLSCHLIFGHDLSFQFMKKDDVFHKK